jgi:hypothetical protein
MKRLTVNKNVSEMGMLDAARSSCRIERIRERIGKWLKGHQRIAES